MIYLAGLLFNWIARALVPALGLLAVGSIVVALVWWFRLRPRRRSPVRAWLALGLVTFTFGTWRTWSVWQDFSHPEFRMFREFVADPIPRDIKSLAPATAAPVMFHDGAYISFVATPTVVDQIVRHSLPGSTALAAIAKVKKSRQSNSTTNDHTVSGTDGQSYRKVDLDWAANDTSSETKAARAEVERFLKRTAGDCYVLLHGGPWGKFTSILLYDPVTARVTLLQYIQRRPAKAP